MSTTKNMLYINVLLNLPSIDERLMDLEVAIFFSGKKNMLLLWNECQGIDIVYNIYKYFSS